MNLLPARPGLPNGPRLSAARAAQRPPALALKAGGRLALKGGGVLKLKGGQ